MVGLAREQVAAARAAVAQQPVTGVAPLDLGAVGRRRAGHRRRRLLLDPAEGGDVLVRAEQDAGLRRAGLRREVGLPLGQRVAALDEPARHVGRVAVAHRPLQHRQREAVDLEVDDARGVRLDALARPPRDPLDHAQRVGVVVVRPEDDVEHDRHGRRDERDAERRPERVDREVAVGDAVGGEQHQRVERSRMSRSPVTSISGSRSAAMTGGSIALRIAITAAATSAPPKLFDVGAGDDPGGDEQRDRREDPRHEDAHEPDARPLRAPRPPSLRSRSSSSRHALTRVGVRRGARVGAAQGAASPVRGGPD